MNIKNCLPIASLLGCLLLIICATGCVRLVDVPAEQSNARSLKKKKKKSASKRKRSSKYPAKPVEPEKIWETAEDLPENSSKHIVELMKNPLPLPKIHPTHPRLFFRSEAWDNGNGLTLAKLRERGRQYPWRPFVEQLHRTPANLALRWLVTGKQQFADAAIRKLQRKVRTAGITFDGVLLEESAITFDWLCSDPNFKGERKAVAIEMLVKAASQQMKRYSRGSHIFHTRMYGWANGILFAGLALWGEHPAAETFVRFGYSYWRTRLMPALRHQAGAWHNGMGYGRHYTVRLAFDFLTAWKSATGEDLWKWQKENEGDWAGEMVKFLVYTLRSDGKHVYFGDCFNANSNQYDYPILIEAAFGSKDPYAAAMAFEILTRHGMRSMEHRRLYYPMLFMDPDVTLKSADSLPLSRLFGKDGLGAVVMRSDWGDDATMIFFKCGDYFGNHGHFDQGSFEIFRSSPLALDAGKYDDFHGRHRKGFYKRSVAHNTLLISDPENLTDDGGQRVFSYQTAGTLKAYLAHKKRETGNILEFKQEKNYTVVVADVTPAYDAKKVKQFTRALIYLDGRYLVVFDTVETVRKNMRLRFLLHYPRDVKIDGTRAVVAHYGGRLVCDALLPKKALLKDVKGFQLDGKDFTPHGNVTGYFSGSGHLEIEPEKGSASLGKKNYFLNVMTIGSSYEPMEKIKRANVQMTKDGIVLEVGGHSFRLALDGKRIERL